MKPTHELLTDIAREHLGIETLETRNRDSLDFHDVSASGVKEALWAAYQAGVNASSGSTGDRILTIEVRGGVVQDVSNIPPGWDYEIIDHDTAE